MKRRIRWMLGSALMAGVMIATGFPQGFPQSSPAAYGNAVPVKIRVILTKGEGDRRVSSPYSLTISSGETTSLRIGAEVPIGITGPGGQLQFTFQQFGTQIDSRIIPAESGGQGRYKVQITITRRDISDASARPTPQGAPSRPILYNFVFAGTLLLGDGETGQIIGTDMLSNETWRADVTLSLK